MLLAEDDDVDDVAAVAVDVSVDVGSDDVAAVCCRCCCSLMFVAGVACNIHMQYFKLCSYAKGTRGLGR